MSSPESNVFRWSLALLLPIPVAVALLTQACAPQVNTVPPACVPQATGTLSPKDPTLTQINADTAAIEATQPSAEDLRKQILTDASQFALQPQELRSFTEGMLSRSAPAPAPRPSASPSPQAYPLHPSVLALATHKRATAFAQDSSQLGLSVADAKSFADGFLRFYSPGADAPARAFAAYVSFYRFLVSSEGLGLASAKAKSFADQAVFYKAKGPQVALTYMEIFQREQDYGANTSAASAAAARATCLSGP